MAVAREHELAKSFVWLPDMSLQRLAIQRSLQQSFKNSLQSKAFFRLGMTKVLESSKCKNHPCHMCGLLAEESFVQE